MQNNERFKFILSNEKDKNVTSEYINSIEKLFNIKFPNILRYYYLNYNFSDAKECSFKIYGIDDDFVLDTIIPLKYGRMPLEKEYEFILKDESISNDFIPLAIDMDSDEYYWNRKSGKVYYISIENVENPILICNSVDEFFDILNKSCDNIITISNLNDDKIIYNKLIAREKQKIVKRSNVKDILKYHNKLLVKAILICFFLTIISLLLVNLTDSLSIILAFVFCIFMLVFIFLDIINRIKSFIAIKRYGKDILEKELENSIKIYNSDTYLTENFIISNTKTIKVTKYSDIDLVFLAEPSGNTRQIALTSLAYVFGGTPLVAYLNGKKKDIAILNDSTDPYIIFDKIREKNPNVLIGYTPENVEKYKNQNKCFKFKWFLDCLFVAFILFIIIIAIVYNLIK